MPTVLRLDGLRVTIYPNDHRPAHVHVRSADGEAVFVLNCPDGPPTIRESYGLSRPALNSLGAGLAPHVPALCLSWERSMPAIEDPIVAAEARMSSLREAGRAVAVSYDRRHRTIAVTLHTGMRLVVPVRLLQGLAGAASRSLDEVEISPSGLGLHWPSIDADVYVPGLLGGVFGTAEWMASLDAASSSPDSESRRSA